jgi:dihydrofolate reductase
MYITLKMMQTLDGSIARNNEDKLDWGSKLDKQDFKKVRLENEIMILGATTFEVTPKGFLKEQKLVIVTSRVEEFQIKYPEWESKNWFFMQPDLQSIVNFLNYKCFKKVLLAGGGQTNNLFLKANLVDEIQLTLAPYIFNSGITTFGSTNLGKIDLELARTKTLGESELLLVYKVNNG